MIPPLLGWEPRAGVPRDPVPERALLALELAALVARLDPVGDFEAGTSLRWGGLVVGGGVGVGSLDFLSALPYILFVLLWVRYFDLKVLLC
jgi:hypothetical protein